MADPLSAAASVAGLVSLGLQVSTGIIKYIDAVKSRDEELTHIRKKNDILLSVIEAIQQSCSSSSAQNPQSTAAVTQTFQLCDTQLKALDSLLAGFTNSSVNPTTHTKVRDFGRKVKYPFKREQVKALTSTLDKAIATLQLAVQSLELDVSQQNSEKLNILQTNLLTTSAAVRSGHNDIQNIIKDLGLQTESQAVRLSAAFIQSTGLLRQDAVAIQRSLESSIRPIITGVSQLDVNHSVHQSTLDAIQRDSQSYQTNLDQRLNRIENLLLGSVLGGDDIPQNQSVGRIQDSRTDKTLQTQMMRRIVAKPQSLKEICDAFELETNNKAEETHLPLPISAGYALADSTRSRSSLLNRYKCDCNARNRLRQHATWLGPFGFFHKTKSTAHLPDCPMSEFPAMNTLNEVGVRFLGLRNLLGSAITLSFMLNSGAGGLSISPAFTYYPTIDAQNEPAFRILSLMRTVSFEIRYSHKFLDDVDKYQSFLNRATFELKEMFRNGKASFLAVDSYNRNLIHYLMDGLMGLDQNITEYCDQYLCDLLEFFKYHQVPLMEYDTMGKTPLYRAVVDPDLVPTKTLETLLNSTTDLRHIFVPPAKIDERDRRTKGMAAEYVEMLAESPLLAEAFDCGPLSQATLADNLNGVQRILGNSTSALEERDVFGRSPLHFAGARPEILGCLLEAASIDQLNAVDISGQSALDYAVILSKTLCRSTDPERRCSRCNCAECVIMLLNAGCSIPNPIFFRHGRSGTIRCRGRILRHAKQRREKLKRLAIENLPDSLVQKIFQTQGVLDFHASQVELMLRGQGISVPRALEVGRGRAGDYSDISLYAGTWKPRDANYSYRIGFIDTDPQPPQDLPIWRGAHRMDYLLWLIDHGVDMSRRLTRQSNEICNAHCILAEVGYYLWLKSTLRGSEECAIVELLRRSHYTSIPDSCQCRCSLGGCTPQISMMKTLMNMYHEWGFVDFDRHLEMLDRVWSSEDHMKAIRFLTFDALELKHTCCDYEWNLNAINDAEEEDRYMVDLFDKLVSEFEDHFHSIPERHSHLDFWRSFWKVRIDEEREKLNGSNLSQEEIQRAIDLGVVWGPSLEPEVQSDQDTWDYWYRQLDEIE